MRRHVWVSNSVVQAWPREMLIEQKSYIRIRMREGFGSDHKTVEKQSINVQRQPAKSKPLNVKKREQSANYPAIFRVSTF